MSEQLRLYGGPLEGLYIEPEKVVDGKFKTGIERESYRPEPKADLMFVWKIAADWRSAEMQVTYYMQDGRLCYPGWKPVPKEFD